MFSLWSVFLWVSIGAWSVVVIALIAAAVTKRAVDDRLLVRIVIAASAATIVALFVLVIVSVATSDAMKIGAPGVLDLGMVYDTQSR